MILGRTNVPELCLSTTTESLAYGPARNPWNPDRSTGGSSGGSAAAVAAGVVPAAHGNDAGGSIRVPASACGLVGLKPTRGRTSFAPDPGGSWAGLNHEHVLTRSVRDSAAVLDAIAGPAAGDVQMAPAPARRWATEVGVEPGRLRIGVLATAPHTTSDDQVVAGVRRTAALLEALGHDVEDDHPPALDEPEPYLLILPAVAARHVDVWSTELGRPIALDELEPFTALMVEMGRGLSAVDLLAAQDATESWSRRAQAWWADGHDVLLTPTMPVLPPVIGTLGPGADHQTLAEGLGARSALTMPFNVTGQPAISLPLHSTTDGLPVGMQLVAASGREDLLFRLAAQLEQARPWDERRPPCGRGDRGARSVPAGVRAVVGGDPGGGAARVHLGDRAVVRGLQL